MQYKVRNLSYATDLHFDGGWHRIHVDIYWVAALFPSAGTKTGVDICGRLMSL